MTENITEDILNWSGTLGYMEKTNGGVAEVFYVLYYLPKIKN